MKEDKWKRATKILLVVNIAVFVYQIVREFILYR